MPFRHFETMNPKQGEYFAQRIFEFDHDAAIDYCGPPTEFAPMSVIFSADASFTDEEMIELSSHLSDLEFLDVSRNQITDTGIESLVGSKSLKIVTVGFHPTLDTIADLFGIPSLRQLRMPPESSDRYKKLPHGLMCSACDRNAIITRIR